MKSPKVRHPLKGIALLLAIAVMLSYLTVQFEDYRMAVSSDTEIYLGCRNFYYDQAPITDYSINTWPGVHEFKEAHSQKMCDDRWTWWNYEIYYQKYFKG